MKNYLINNFNLNELVNVFDELPLCSAPFELNLFVEIITSDLKQIHSAISFTRPTSPVTSRTFIP